MAEDIHTWASSEGLSRETVQVLMDQEFTTVDDLRELEPDDLVDIFQRPQLLMGRQFLALKKAIARLSQGDTPGGPSSSSGIRSSASPYSKSTSREQDDMEAQFASEHLSVDSEVNQSKMTQPRSGHVQGAVAKFSQWLGGAEGLHKSAKGPVSKPAKKSKGIFGGLKDIVFGSDGTENEVFRMLMLGKTGSGKSTTGNTILGEKKFASGLDFSSVTGVCDMQIVEKGGRIIELMDCPGLYDTTLSNQEIATTIVQAVACMHPGPHAILYVIRLGRFTAEEIGVFLRLKALFDDDITNYMIVVFTGGDDLEREKITLAELLKRAPKQLIQVLDECGHRCFVFNNIDKKNKKQVEQLLDEVRRLKMAYASYNCSKYASVGQDLEKEVERRLAKVTKKDQEREQYILNLEIKLDDTTEIVQKMKAENEKKEREREMEKQKKAQEEENICQEMAKALSEEEKNLKEKELQSYREREREELSKLKEEREKETRQLIEKQNERERLKEQRREEEREDHRRREEAYREELNRMKEGIANNKEPGWLNQAATGVASGFKAVAGWIW